MVVVGTAACDSATPVAQATVTPPVTSRATVTPRPTGKPTPIPSPTSTAEDFDATIPPKRPTALDGPPSEESAAEAAKYFLALFPYVFATGDLAEWRAMSGESCKYCAGTVEQVETEQAAGKRRTGGRIEIDYADSVLVDGRQYGVGVTFREHEGKLFRSDGSVEKDIDYVLEARMEFLVSWTEHGWRVDGVDIKWSNPV
ncbi:DUF6318 family protein [Cellulomonas sp. PSBB021]|uniref:DUF6318 family protein n=1 Tax=Cellulomonas sp. PSBB021 TaxID=2003551 RepID=UPI0012FD616B|nr:DUF6318 family protein [Cellulomonas sp. PSBB021]